MNDVHWQMTMKRPFTVQEMKLMDSEWDFEHPGGCFAIEFHADGLNSCAPHLPLFKSLPPNVV